MVWFRLAVPESKPIPGVPESEGFPRNSVQFRDYRNSGIDGNRKEFRGIPELEPVPGIPESVELDQSRVGLLCCVSIEFPELDGIDFGAEPIPAMFNIAE
jgi:hypothetical protein